MIKAIFYSKFDTQEGPKVVHQVPDGAIAPSPNAPPPLFNFSDISFFVIPRQELCGNLIHVCAGGYRILGNPICMESPSYDRNEFIFNFCIVLAEEEEWGSFRSVVQKLADLMYGLEEQSGFLSKDVSRGGEGKVHGLCETLMEDLNNYCECMIPIDDLNTLNLKLFPIYPSPPAVKSWQVPLFTVRYEAFMDENWDLTMQRIVPYINGVNSIRIISVLAGADFDLTCRAIRHLVYYGCIFLLDIFSFNAIYAVTAQFSSTIASDEAMQRECAFYVNTRFASVPFQFGRLTSTTASTASPSSSVSRSRKDVSSTATYVCDAHDIWPALGDYSTSSSSITGGSKKFDSDIVDGVGIVELYASLKQGQSVRQWYLDHMRELTNIDVRRFITFGIIKGFLYRVHKYAYATGAPAQHSMARRMRSVSHTTLSMSPSFSRGRMGSVAGSGDISSPSSAAATAIAASAAGRRRSGAFYNHHPYREEAEYNYNVAEEVDDEDDPEAAVDDEEDDDAVDDETLGAFLDGTHCFDEICTELEMSEKELTTRLKRYPVEVLIIHR